LHHQLAAEFSDIQQMFKAASVCFGLTNSSTTGQLVMRFDRPEPLERFMLFSSKPISAIAF